MERFDRLGASGRNQRLRSPLLIAVALLLAFEAAGGLVLFTSRLIAGRAPGETLHVLAGAGLAALYAIYQVRHWSRVRPIRRRLDYGLGLIAAVAMALTLASGFILAFFWWRARGSVPQPGEVEYPALWSAVHNIASLLVLTFVGAHFAAVLFRDRQRD